MPIAYGIGGVVDVPDGAITGAGAPPASLVGGLGQIYRDKTNDVLYIYDGNSWAQNNVTLSTDGTFAAASDSTASSSLAIKTYVDSTASFGAPIAGVKGVGSQGIGYVASDAEAVALQANTANVESYFLTPSNLTAIFASPQAIGGTTAAAGTFTDLTADGTGAVSLGSNAAGDFTVTGASTDLTLQSSGGSVNMLASEAAANAIRIYASDAAGGIDVDCGSGGFALDAASGAISLDSALASNFTVTGAADLTLHSSAGAVNLTSGEANADSVLVTSAGGIELTATGAAAKDLALTCTNGSISLTAGEAVVDAIKLNASAGGVESFSVGQNYIKSTQNAADAVKIESTIGGIEILASGASPGEDILLSATGSSVTISATEDAANNIYLHANGGTSETIKIHSDQGTGTNSINLLSDVGGISLEATALADASAIELNAAAGGLKLLAGGGAGLDTVITNTSGSFLWTAGEAAADAIVINASDAAGGMQLQAGSNGILIGNQADCAVIDLGDIAPTASRLVTVAGGTVVTASVTDQVDIAPDGATTNADSIKKVTLNNGGVTLGQILTDIASGAITSGTHTTNIASGNVTAGTVALNIFSGTGTKTLTIGNADANTTIDMSGVMNLNDSVNANVKLLSGTATGTLTVGNGAAGAITVDSGAGISIDAAGASNFSTSSGDLTLAASTNSVNINAAEAVSDAMVLNASAGGLQLLAGGGAGLDTLITNTSGSISIDAGESASDSMNLTASGAAGAINFSAGTGGFTFDSGITLPVTAKTAAYNVTTSDFLLTGDTSITAAFSFTLPAAPATGQVYFFSDVGGNAGTANITVDGNGKNILSGGASAGTAVINSDFGHLWMWYSGAVWCCIDVA